jgi:hypothetical protein
MATTRQELTDRIHEVRAELAKLHGEACDLGDGECDAGIDARGLRLEAEFEDALVRVSRMTPR